MFTFDCCTLSCACLERPCRINQKQFLRILNEVRQRDGSSSGEESSSLKVSISLDQISGSLDSDDPDFMTDLYSVTSRFCFLHLSGPPELPSVKKEQDC